MAAYPYVHNILSVQIWPLEKLFLLFPPDTVQADAYPLKEKSERMLYRANIYLKPADWVSQMSDVFSY